MLQCYDNVRPDRLPAVLRDEPPHIRVFRLVDGEWAPWSSAARPTSACS